MFLSKTLFVKRETTCFSRKHFLFRERERDNECVSRKHFLLRERTNVFYRKHFLLREIHNVFIEHIFA